MTPDEFIAIRDELGLSLRGLARLFRMGKHGSRNIHRWEKGQQDIPGWATLVMEILSTGKLPDLREFKRKR